MGNRSKSYLKARREWIKENQPDHQGYYVCALCGIAVHYSDMEVDHELGRRGELLVDKAHFQPTHVICNRDKGSKKQESKVSSTEYAFRRTLDL